MLHPIIGNTLRVDLGISKDLAAARLKRSSEGTLVRALDVKGTRVLLRPNIDAPKARVRETRGAFTLNSNGGRKGRGQRVGQILK